MKTILKSLAGNTIIFAIGNSVSILLTFVMVPFYTTILSPADFGVSDILTTTTAMLVPLVSLNVFSAIFRFALDDENRTEIFTNGLLISLIGGGLSLVLSVILELFGINYSFLVGVYLGITLLLNLFQNFTRGINRVKSFAISGIIATLSNVLSNVILMWVFKFGLKGYLYSLIISALTTTIFLFLNNKLHTHISFKKKSWSSTKQLLTYSIPMIPNSFAWWLTNDANKLIILAFVGPSANGIFAIANKIPTMVTTIFGMFSNAWQMTAVKEKEKSYTNKLYSLTFNLMFGGLLIISAIVVIFIQWFMGFYVSDKFYEAWKIVPILLMTSFFSNMSAFFGTTYLVAKKTTGLFTTTIWGTIINIALSFALVPLIGINGAGISGAVGFFIVSILRLKQTSEWIKIQVEWKLQGLLILGYVTLTIIAYINFSLIIIKVTIIMIMMILLFRYIKKIQSRKNL
ncbi:membrane protein [Lactococcus chungangensis CAU 28 = DSM 22330]|uniref:Membrane protein n=2 Tax=Pseudolactococcus chungangensis CAU 28 = DSM 22330 TaxID=1122154 RepID=A0ABX4I7M0_9LACT|nr:oligosaccharide flippase family protein [Lactococcus chungangensis]NBK98273.1 lipopolysaccharide biosynthesis protein [Erysipelotrichia bacterium]PCS02262.1 membrane protein [Lactococcus chungangensis CAU 28 = DSM 22330]